MASVLVSSLLFLFGSHRCDCVCDGVFRKGVRQSGRRKHTNRHKHRMMQHSSWWWQICCVYVFVIGGKKKNQCLSVSPSRSLPHPASSTRRHSSESSLLSSRSRLAEASPNAAAVHFISPTCIWSRHLTSKPPASPSAELPESSHGDCNLFVYLFVYLFLAGQESEVATHFIDGGCN